MDVSAVFNHYSGFSQGVKTNPICGVRASPSCKRSLMDGLPRAADASSNEINTVLVMETSAVGCKWCDPSYIYSERVRCAFAFIQILRTIYRFTMVPLPENCLMEMQISHLGSLGSRLISTSRVRGLIYYTVVVLLAAMV